tara:strand:+ start:442 stop:1200 length:759 start_codon:yes stop_codon:yes gene_type:complete
MASIIQSRRDTAANWTSVNPVLAQGEKGYEVDSIGSSEAKNKIGDGLSDWDSLDYQVSGKVKSVNGEEGDVVLDTSDIADTTDKRYVTDAKKTVLDNTSNTNTGDQDLSSLQPILSEGAFVDGDKTNLDNQSNINTGDETTGTIQSKRPIKTVNGSSLEGSGDVVTPDTTYSDSEIKTKYENNANTNAFTDTEKTNLSNQSNTNTGDQDISAKIEATNYATFDTGGTVKMSRNTATSDTYISFDGSDTPNVT